MGAGQNSAPDSVPRTESAARPTASPGGHIPPRQHPYEQALQAGLDDLTAHPPSQASLASLGAWADGRRISVPVLDHTFLVDLESRDVFVDGAGRAKRAWAVLVVHYLQAPDVTSDQREVAFAHFDDCRGYVNVFEKRIVGRFLATSGRTADQFAAASERLGAARVSGPGLPYRFFVLPRVPITIARYEGDEEFGPGASIVYRADAARLLPAEDRVVVTELLLDALAGKSLVESQAPAPSSPEEPGRSTAEGGSI